MTKNSEETPIKYVVAKQTEPGVADFLSDLAPFETREEAYKALLEHEEDSNNLIVVETR